jgi:hypothetical protein
MVLITIPIVWFIRQAGGVLTFLTPIIILGNLVIANIIFHKTSDFKPFQDNLLATSGNSHFTPKHDV